MKLHKWPAVLLALTLTVSLAGCGQTTEASASASPSASPETFGDMSAVEAAEAAKTSGTPAATVSAPADDSTAASAESPADASAISKDLTLLAVKSVVYCDYFDQLTYDATDPVYYWRAMGYLIGLVGTQDPNVTITDDGVELNTTELPPFENALFGDAASECPSVTEEDPFVAEDTSTICSSGATLDTYKVTVRDFGGVEVTMTEPADQGNGTYLTNVTLTDGPTTKNYVVTLTDSTYVVEQNKLFDYSVAGIEAE